MKKTIIIGLCLTLALALIGTAAMAWGPGFGRGFGAGPGSGYPAIPNLTAEQSAQIKVLQEAFLKETEPLQKEMAAKGEELRGFRFAPNSDAAAVRAKQEDLFALRTQLQEKGNNLRAEVQKLLTPEQLAQLPAVGPGRGFGPVAGFGPGAGFGPMGGPRGRW
ncbi:MAG: Spy/CpxP family protein refolding chaperone [Deltaproteobacteria bacterium]|nr:Spy/CpxP family protein refolding chaperone [Deltaproteobacteria bacterium]